MPKYMSIIDQCDGGGFRVTFPDFPGFTVDANTLEQCCDIATIELAVHIDRLMDAGISIAPPSSLDEVAERIVRPGSVIMPVKLGKAASARLVAIKITIEDLLLCQIDRAAKARGMTRSGFIAEAARRMIHANG